MRAQTIEQGGDVPDPARAMNVHDCETSCLDPG
jgi:hypothetical protein